MFLHQQEKESLTIVHRVDGFSCNVFVGEWRCEVWIDGEGGEGGPDDLEVVGTDHGGLVVGGRVLVLKIERETALTRVR